MAIEYTIYKNGVAIGTTTGLSFNVTDLVPGTRYEFTIKATDADGNVSNSSEIVTVNTLAAPDITKPSVPASLTATTASATQIDLAWSTSTDNVAVTGYRVKRNGIVIDTTENLTYSDTGLNSSTLYFYTVAAYDAAGNFSSESNVASDTTDALADTTAPTVPTGLTVTVRGSDKLLAAWTASTDAVGVVGYKVYLDGVFLTNVTGGATEYELTGLSSSTEYDITVAAYDAVPNVSDQCAIVSATTSPGVDGTAPTVPANLVASVVSSSAIDLDWDVSTDAVGVTGYNIYRDDVLIDTSATNSYSDTGLFASTEYSYQVSAFDAEGNTSAKSTADTATTSAAADTTAPTKPATLTATVNSASQITLSWSASTDAVGVVGYRVYRGIPEIGYVGASMAQYAVLGAETAGFNRFWSSNLGYGGGGIFKWADELITGGSNQSNTSANMNNLTLAGNPATTAGTTWTYTSTDAGTDYNMTGLLYKPTTGSGPFPAIIVSHGFGSSAQFGSFRNQGLVVIATNYTHAGGTTNDGLLPDGNEGASAENILRAHKCWDILKGLGYVDMRRVAAHGHSMGAFVTAALVGTYPDDFLVATHTAGGVNDSNVPWTKEAQANGITIPYLMQHGTSDNTVPVADDRTLRDILTANGVTNNLIEYTGLSHSDMISSAHPEIGVATKAWQTTHGLFTSGTGTGTTFWNKFDAAYSANPTTIFWLQLASLAADEANETLTNAQLVVNEIKARVPGAVVYVSAQPEYTAGNVCSLAGSTGPSRMATLRDDLVSNGDCLLGPVIGPLVYPDEVQQDGCHQNTAGQAANGLQLIAFFKNIGMTLIATNATTTYANSGLTANTQYSYQVSAYDAAGNESIPANVATATTQTGTGAQTRALGIWAVKGPSDPNNADGTPPVVNRSFVDGIVFRTRWSILNTADGVYNFTLIEDMIDRVTAIDQYLSLVVFTINPPAYVVAGAGLTFVNGQNSVTNPVPWDAYAMGKWEAFCQAMGDHVYEGYQLRNHPRIKQVDCSILGTQGLRFLTAPAPTVYTQTLYKNACLDSIHAMVDQFPDKICYYGLFGTGNGAQRPDAVVIRDAILAEFNGVANPVVGVYQETWTGSVPTAATGQLVYDVRNQAAVMLQACGEFGNQGAWSQCNFPAGDNLQSAATYAINNFNCTYLEIYNSDLNAAGNQTILTNIAAQLQAKYDELT